MEQRTKVAILAQEILAVLADISKQKQSLSLPLLQRQLWQRSNVKQLFRDSSNYRKEEKEDTFEEATPPPEEKTNRETGTFFENQSPLQLSTATELKAAAKIEILKRIAIALAIVAKRDGWILLNEHLEELKKELQKEVVDSARLQAVLSSIKDERLRLEEGGLLSTEEKDSLNSRFSFSENVSMRPEEESHQGIEIYRNALEQFAEQLYLPEGDSFASRASALVSKLTQPVSWSELLNIEQEIHALLANFVDEASKQRDKLIDLLHDVAIKLVETEKEFISTLINDSKGHQEDEDRFQQTIAKEVSDIEDSFSVSKDLKDIQALVFNRLNAIRQAITEKKKIEQQRIQKSEKKIQHLQKRLSQNQKELTNIQRVAEQDPLTGIPNRRALWRRLGEQLDRFNRYRESCSFIIIDVDHFKEVNDQYGHLNGDKVLQTIGRRLKDRLRKTDLYARYGGEEFCVLLPHQRAKDACIVAEELRMMIKSFEFIAGEKQVHVTVSLGVTEFRVGDLMEDVIKRADEALYRAKELGRDRVISAE
jgi:diguanylate cyclase